MMDYRENAGYIITDSCHVGDSEFVLGVHLTAPQQFVTWKCSNRTDYDWGHYFSDLFSAQKDLVARAQEEVQCLEESAAERHCAGGPFLFPVGAISRNVKRSAPAFIPFPPQGMAELWCAGNWRKRYSEKKRWAAPFVEGGYLCFEEDCDAQVALRELMDKKMIQAPCERALWPRRV